MVECGGCDHRFRVVEDVIIRERKFYPGERAGSELHRFRRTPIKEVPNPEFQTINRVPEDPAPMPGDISPLRSLLGVFGLLVVIIVALFLVFGGSEGGMLDGASMNKRLVLAGFAAVVAGLLIILGFPAARKRAVMGSLLTAALLLGLPFYFSEGLPDEPTASEINTAATDENPSETAPQDPYAALKHEVGYAKLAEALNAYGEDRVDDGKSAYGIWLREMRISQKDQVADYLKQSTSASGDSWMYSRPPSDYLMVLDRVEPNMAALVRYCQRFGEVRRTWPELNLIEVVVNPKHFSQPPISKLNDQNDPDFYQLNWRELESINLQRALSAVKRLESAKPTAYRSDIVKRLHELIALGGDEMQEAIVRTLDTWAEEGDGSLEVVRETAKAFFERNETMPRSMVEFLTSRRDEPSLELLHQLWRSDMTGWETYYSDMGALIEDDVLKVLPELSPLDQFSAVRLLRRVGTAKSLPVLKEQQKDAVPEMKELITQAIDAINERVR